MTVLASTSDFSAAYRDHYPLAFSAAYRVLRDASTAEDVVQDVFTTLWRHPISSILNAEACRATWQ